MKKKTTVVHCTRSKFDVYIGRPEKWGNPWSHEEDSLAKYKVETREEAIAKHKEWFLANPQLIEEAYNELLGKRLGCWCKPKACHGDIIAETINQIYLERRDAFYDQQFGKHSDTNTGNSDASNS